MAHKSKTQRAKASVAKANRRERQERDEAAGVSLAESSEQKEPESKGGLLKKKSETSTPATQQTKAVKKAEAPKKTRFQFLKDVRAEMKRVTWPDRQDVTRWTGVVVGALIFFGVYVAVLDNVIITPALVALSGLGA